jgi:hypothetical protein
MANFKSSIRELLHDRNWELKEAQDSVDVFSEIHIARARYYTNLIQIKEKGIQSNNPIISVAEAYYKKAFSGDHTEIRDDIQDVANQLQTWLNKL